MMKTATAYAGEEEGSSCVYCPGSVYGQCLVCRQPICYLHAWEAHLHAQRVRRDRAGDGVDVTHLLICQTCLLQFLDDHVYGKERDPRKEV